MPLYQRIFYRMLSFYLTYQEVVVAQLWVQFRGLTKREDNGTVDHPIMTTHHIHSFDRHVGKVSWMFSDIVDWQT